MFNLIFSDAQFHSLRPEFYSTNSAQFPSCIHFAVFKKLTSHDYSSCDGIFWNGSLSFIANTLFHYLLFTRETDVSHTVRDFQNFVFRTNLLF
jgi:hypothetical protein